MANTFYNRSAKYTQSKSFLTRSSRYVGALASFVEDTKPYHSKLTDVVEEYQFADTMSVKFTETTRTVARISSTTLFNYFSGGVGSSLSIPLKALHSPFGRGNPLNTDVSLGSIKVGRDEVSELSTMPYVYSKQTFDGVAEVLVEREGDRQRVEPLYEGLDYFISQGAFQFKVRQIYDANGAFLPTWVDSRRDGVITHSVQQARRRENDITNPTSAIFKVKALLTQIQALSLSPTATTLVNGLIAGVNGAPQLGAYNLLKSALITDGFPDPNITGYALVEWALERQAQLTAAAPVLTSLLVDLDLIHLPWSNVSGDPAVPFYRSNYEELLNQLISDSTPPLAGYAGWVGDSGVSTSQFVSEAFAALSPPHYFGIYGEFDVREPGHPEYNDVGNAFATITNIDAKPSADPSDVWTITAVDATSSTYQVVSAIDGFVGYVVATPTGTTFTAAHVSFVITELAQPPLGEALTLRSRNRIVFGPATPLETWTIVKTAPISYTRPTLISTRYGFLTDLALIDTALDTGYVVLTARADGHTFDVTHDRMPGYVGVATVGSLYSNHIAFRINDGTASDFHEGDRFYIHIANEPAKVENLDLGFGYDLDSYDNQDALYEAGGDALNFAYATRFTDYDLDSLNLQLAQTAVNGRKWRITAIPDLAQPIAPVGGTPVPSSLSLYYATSFDVSYSDNDFNTSTSIGTVSVGTAYSNSTHGISFIINAGSRPFIGVVTDDVPAVRGGDVFSFSVSNLSATLDELPIGLSSYYAPRLMPRGKGFYEAEAATWTVAFTSTTTFTVTGLTAAGQLGPTTCTLATPGVSASEGYSFNGLGIQFVLKPGDAGFAAGDSITFKTFERKPTYLVHGSASGWQADATVGETYWNGKVGFTIQPPTAALFNSELILPTSSNVWTVGAGTLSLTRLRFDAPNRTYTLTPMLEASVNVGWTIHIADHGIVGRLPLVGTFTDDHITLTAAVSAADVTPLRLVVTADDFEPWAGQDVVILRSTALSRLPLTNDFVLIDGRQNESLGISLNYDISSSTPSITQLAPITIDARFIDVSTGVSQIALNTTSPETDILSTWLPLTLTLRDSESSIAEFPDAPSVIDIHSTTSTELVGTLTGSLFKWDSDFVLKYLPLNAEANIVVYNAGTTERVRANITETINFFISAGLTTTDYLLKDNATITLSPTFDWVINISEQEDVGAAVHDAQTGKFIAGLGNLPYDLEDNVDGYYDLGVPMTSTFMDAKELSVLIAPTTAQSLKLQHSLTLLDGFLVDGDIAQTSLVDFLGLVEAHVAAHPQELISSFTGGGYPESGLAVSSTMQDALSFTATNITTGLAVAILHSNTLPIGQDVPNPLNITPTTTYEGFSTPLVVATPANVVQLRFLWTDSNYAAFLAMPIPEVWVWLPGAASAVQLPATRVLMHEAVPTDYTLHQASWAIEVTLPALTEAKIYLKPGA